MTDTTCNVSVVIPSQDRPGRLLRAVESVLSTAPCADVVCVLQDGDDESRAILGPLEAKGEVSVTVIDGDPTTAERWNAGAGYAIELFDPDYFVIGADDIIFQEGWLEAAMRVMQSLGGSGLVGLNEGPESSFGALATHFLVSRNYAATGLGGSLMPPPYRHGYTDLEATMRARRDARLAFAEGAKIYHEHPFYDRIEPDAIYKKGDSSKDEDEELFSKRMALGFPNNFKPVITRKPPDGWGSVAVGLRAYRNSDADFLRAWTKFLMGGLRRGDRVIDIGVGMGKPHHMAANEIVKAFLKTDCDSLLLVDDDMIIPVKGLEAMRANEENWHYDIVQGFCTHKTAPPHAIALVLSDEQADGEPESLRGPRYNALAHLPEKGARKVDAVGIAFTLVKRHVFESMIGEHGVEYTPWFDFLGCYETEDMRFSQKVRAHGYTMAVDTHADIGHIGTHVFGRKEHSKYVELLENKQWENIPEKT